MWDSGLDYYTRLPLLHCPGVLVPVLEESVDYITKQPVHHTYSHATPVRVDWRYGE